MKIEANNVAPFWDSRNFARESAHFWEIRGFARNLSELRTFFFALNLT
jgi:hypothetical protein